MVLTLHELKKAAKVVATEAVRTPVLTSEDLDAELQAAVFCKSEIDQRAGSFKFRGAFHRLSKIPIDDRPQGVVAVSSGNHGAAVACAAELFDMPATIFLPFDAPQAKRSLIEHHGAEIVGFDRLDPDREGPARELASSTGATFVHPFEDRAVMAGQGTTALELFDEVGSVDALVVPVGGGGLMAGCGSAARHLAPYSRIFGVEPEVADDTQRSLEARRPVTIDPPKTVADGLAVTAPGYQTFAINLRVVESVLTVGEDEILDAVELIADTLGVVAEPSGAVAVAALRRSDHRAEVAGGFPVDPAQRIGLILTGGNTDRV